MPRPQRCRRICREPMYKGFAPEGASAADTVTLTTDEFEAIRLIDLEQYTQEQCAEIMESVNATVAFLICPSALPRAMTSARFATTRKKKSRIDGSIPKTLCLQIVADRAFSFKKQKYP